MRGINGPNNFVHGPRQLAGGAENLIGISGSLRESLKFTANTLTQHRDAREAGAEIIVDVASNPGALAFDCMLSFHLLQPGAHTTTGYRPR